MDGRTWDDLTEIPDEVWNGRPFYSYTTKNSNVCLKAFTRPLPVSLHAEVKVSQDQGNGQQSDLFLTEKPITYEIALTNDQGQKAPFQTVSVSLVKKDGDSVNELENRTERSGYTGKFSGTFTVSEPGNYELLVKDTYGVLTRTSLVVKDVNLYATIQVQGGTHYVGDTINLEVQAFENDKSMTFTSLDAYVTDPQGKVLNEEKPYQIRTNYSGKAYLSFLVKEVGSYSVKITTKDKSDQVLVEKKIIVNGDMAAKIQLPSSGFKVGKSTQFTIQIFNKGKIVPFASFSLVLKDKEGKPLEGWNPSKARSGYQGISTVTFTPQEVGEYTLTVLGADGSEEVLAEEVFSVLGE